MSDHLYLRFNDLRNIGNLRKTNVHSGTGISSILSFACLFLLPLLSGCESRTHLHLCDDYYVSCDSIHGEGYFLWTTPGYETDVHIDNLRSIQWNQQYLIARQIQHGEDVWFIVKARGKHLKAGNYDSIAGPLTLAEKKEFLQHHQTGSLKKETFSYPGSHRFEYTTAFRREDKQNQSISQALKGTSYWVHGDEDEGYLLRTEEICSEEAYIENLRSIRWNEQFIVAEQILDNSRERVYYIIWALDEGLAGCAHDSISGPFSWDQKEEFLRKHDIGPTRKEKFPYSEGYNFQSSPRSRYE